jgi:mycofactocin precursor
MDETTTLEATDDTATTTDRTTDDTAEVEGVEEELLIEEVSIDGMCGVY